MQKIVIRLVPALLISLFLFNGVGVRAAEDGWTVIAGCETDALDDLAASLNTAIAQSRAGEAWRIHSLCKQGEWAYAYVKGYYADGTPLPDTSDVALAQLDGKAWVTALPEDATTYNRWLAVIPEILIPVAARGMLAQPAMRVPSRTAQFSGYYLPYPAGQSAYTHRHWYPAADFDIGGPPYVGTVRNAKGGTAVFVKDSSATECGDPPPDYVCWLYANVIVIQTGDNEFAWYMHFAQNSIPDWIKEGVYVPAGATLGTEGATGWASGPHVHFQVASSYWCCQGSGDTLMPDWPFTTMYTVDFNEYAWWDLPYIAISQNGSGDDDGRPAPPENTPEPTPAPVIPPKPISAPPPPVSAPPPTPEPMPVVAPATVNGCANPYTIVAGDWLYRIADNCGVTLEGIVAVNPGLNPDWIKAGNLLNLPANPPAGPPALPAVTDVSLPPDVGAAVSPSPLPQPLVASSSAALKTGCVGPHTVLAGENLFRIALNCGLTTEQMAAVNGIADPYVIYPGQVLVYP